MNTRDENSIRPLLENGLVHLGLSQDRILSLLIKYIEEIELFNEAYGLVKVKDRGELIAKHIFDSLAPISIFHGLPNNKVADVGSGAGLPGIPLAVCMPGTEFTLIERMGRRAGFLRNAIAVLGLPNVRVEESDMEKLAVTEKFDLIVFRAFKPFNSGILKGLLRLLAPGGIIAAYKGRRQSVEDEMGEALGKNQSYAQHSWEVVPVEVPFLEEERHLVLIRT